MKIVAGQIVLGGSDVGGIINIREVSTLFFSPAVLKRPGAGLS
jgi:hypothetical protein